MRVGVKALRQALHLPAGTPQTAAAIDVVVDSLGRRHHVHDMHQRVDAAGKTGAYDGVGMVLLDETHGANGSINLADATLPKHYIVVAETTAVATDGVVHLPILDVHCYDNSYLHESYCFLQKYEKNRQSEHRRKIKILNIRYNKRLEQQKRL
jgi:hypothetical protein